MRTGQAACRVKLQEFSRLGREEESELGKKTPKARREDRVKHERARRDTSSRCFYNKRARSAHLNKILT